MRPGQIIEILRDHESPQKSPNTDLVASWLTAGGQLLKPNGYEDVMEGEQRAVTWLIDGDVKCRIDEEEMEFGIFKKRFLDREWCEANPDSVISFMRAFRDNLRDLKTWAKSQSTGIKRRDSRGVGVLYPNSPEWLKQEFANRFLQ